MLRISRLLKSNLILPFFILKIGKISLNQFDHALATLGFSQ